MSSRFFIDRPIFAWVIALFILVLGAAAVGPDTMYLNLGTAVVAGLHGPEYQFDKAYRTLAAGIPD